MLEHSAIRRGTRGHRCRRFSTQPRTTDAGELARSGRNEWWTPAEEARPTRRRQWPSLTGGVKSSRAGQDGEFFSRAVIQPEAEAARTSSTFDALCVLGEQRADRQRRRWAGRAQKPPPVEPRTSGMSSVVPPKYDTVRASMAQRISWKASSASPDRGVPPRTLSRHDQKNAQ